MKPETKEKIRQWQQNWERKQRAMNPAYKIKYNIKSRLGLLLKKQKITKRERTLDYVGCSFEDLKNHLEKQFKKDMTWDNYGLWHIDHIKPCASFDLVCPVQQLSCFHYKNLQPLWASENMSKGSKLIDISK